MTRLARLAAFAAALGAARATAGLGRVSGEAAGGLWAASLAAYNAGEFPAALSKVRVLLSDAPDEPLYRMHEAAILFQTGDFRGAAAAAERYFRTAPNPTLACRLLGNAYQGAGDEGAYLEARRRCAEADPLDVMLAFDYGVALEQAGRLAESARLFERLAAEGYLGALISLGRVRLAQGDAGAAARLAAQALSRDPGNAAARILAGQAAARRP